jgi:hypothetical protein
MKKNLFRELHEFCQTLTPKVPRNSIIDTAKKLTGVEKLRVMKTSLDTSVTRGYFLSAKNVDHPWVKMHGCDVIVLARGLNPCWERFVNVKEAMHLFDEEFENTSSSENFEQLLNNLLAPAVERSPQVTSDIMAIWMALACLCPEKSRQEFQQQLSNEKTDNYQIALKLRIPEQYVPLLFSPNYAPVLKVLRAE